MHINCTLTGNFNLKSLPLSAYRWQWPPFWDVLRDVLPIFFKERCVLDLCKYSICSFDNSSNRLSESLARCNLYLQNWPKHKCINIAQHTHSPLTSLTACDGKRMKPSAIMLKQGQMCTLAQIMVLLKMLQYTGPRSLHTCYWTILPPYDHHTTIHAIEIWKEKEGKKETVVRCDKQLKESLTHFCSSLCSWRHLKAHLQHWHIQ